MRVAVLGSGGIGGYYGALLARSGHDVAFIARGAHLEAMQRRGLTVRTSEGESTIPVTASADTASVGTVDLVLFSVKSYDTATAAQALTPLMARDTMVITFQNGLDNVEAIASVAGSEAVLAGAVYVALQLVGPGVILRMGDEGRIVFGELSGTLTERVQRIAGALRQSGIPHEVTTDIRRVLWDKFLFITGIGGVTALARSGIGPLLASAAGRSLLHAACGEIVEVAQAESAHLQPAAVDAALAQAATLPARWRSSMARDLEEGRRLEVDTLSGAVVRRGTKHGIPTPVHQTIVACLSVHPSHPHRRRKNPTRARRFEPEQGGGHATHGHSSHRDGRRIRHRRRDRSNVRA
jgi:2-dehydropantoate 2-reductase